MYQIHPSSQWREMTVSLFSVWFFVFLSHQGGIKFSSRGRMRGEKGHWIEKLLFNSPPLVRKKKTDRLAEEFEIGL